MPLYTKHNISKGSREVNRIPKNYSSMASIMYWVSRIRKMVKNQTPLVARAFGLELLNKAQTEDLLRPFQIASTQGYAITLPGTSDFTDETKRIFSETAITTAYTHVWYCKNTAEKMSQLRNGSVAMGNKVVDTDFGTAALFKDLFSTKKRDSIDAKTLIAPWSHYWGGYYDFLLFVAAKLCRIKDALPEEVVDNAVVAYPLLNTQFEREILELIGFRPEAIIDSRTNAVQFRTCILGDNDLGWFYPSIADILSLKKHITARMPPPTGLPKRIYISRLGRRRILNEAALIRLLEQYDFSVIDDTPRSFAGQFAIYANASFIIGPHGASFANVLWCQPGTHLCELFAPNYAPDYFRYLAQVLGLTYSAYCHGPVGAYDHSHVNADIFVSLDDLEKQLVRLFETSNL